MGAAAVLCKKYNCTPRELLKHISELQQIILKHDGFIPGVQNCDNTDLARTAHISASSYIDGGEPQKVTDGISRRLGAETHGWISDDIRENGEMLTMRWDEPQTLSQLRLTFHSDFRYPIRVTMAPNRQKQQRIGIPPELVRDYRIVLKKDKKIVRDILVTDNHQRHVVHPFPATECDTVEITVTATNGATNVTVFEVRAYGAS